MKIIKRQELTYPNGDSVTLHKEINAEDDLVKTLILAIGGIIIAGIGSWASGSPNQIEQ